MGCATLLHAAMRDPGRFDGLTLMLPPTAWESRAAKAAEYLAAADRVEQQGMAAFDVDPHRELPPAQAGIPDTEPDVDLSIFPALLRGAAMSDLPTLEAISTIDARVTLLAWVGDAGHPLSTAEALLTALPNASLQVARTPEDVARWPGVLLDDVAAGS
jgi:hypothetical protein